MSIMSGRIAESSVGRGHGPKARFFRWKNVFFGFSDDIKQCSIEHFLLLRYLLVAQKQWEVSGGEERISLGVCCLILQNLLTIYILDK